MTHRFENEGNSRLAAGSIYATLATHQRTEDWYGRDLLSEFQAWGDRFDAEFKLNAGEVALRVDTLPVTELGHYRPEHNGFGLRGEVALNARYLTDRPAWQVLGTLLHQYIHAWQHSTRKSTRRDYHDLAYRRKAAELGLLVDRQGDTDFLLNSPFMDQLRCHGIEVPTEADDGTECQEGSDRWVARGPARSLKGQSKLAAWSCGCTNVRCAVADLRARCLKCGAEFTKRA